MAQRAGWLVIALLGVLLVAGLALLGRDIRRAAETGPRWRRRVLGAALALLAAIGLVDAMRTDSLTRPQPRPSCYVAPVESLDRQFQSSMQFMSGRLTLLDKFLASKRLDARVVGDVLRTIEERLPLLFNRPDYSNLSATERCEADNLRIEIEAKIADLKARLKDAEHAPKR